MKIRSLPNVCGNLHGGEWPKLQNRWNHLKDLDLASNDGPVELLLGLDAGHLIEPLEYRRGKSGDPYAFKTKLGWVCRGRVNSSELPHTWNNFIESQDVNLETRLHEYFTDEAYGTEKQNDQANYSLQDQYAMKMIDENMRKLPNQPGYEVALPWIPGVPKPENNRALAEKRLTALEKKFDLNPGFKQMYVTAMSKTIDEGYAKKISDPRELEAKFQYFLPHHGVLKKCGSKIRVVFDSASKFKGLSLNDRLLSGPPLQNDLMDVLVRFREHPVAVSADIEAMFSRILVREEDARFHRFLWREDSTSPIEVYQMTGVVFGDTSSPCLAIRTLLRTADDVNCSEDSKSRIRNQFYVDDYLDSYEDPCQAISSSREIRTVVSEGNFNLRDWKSNHTEVAFAIGGSSQEVLDLDKDHSTKVLGLEWHPSSDSLGFSITPQDIALTRRGLLSRLCSIYDPLGLCAPVTVAGKIRMKSLVVQGKDWDEAVCQDDENWWLVWNDSLNLLRNSRFPRCFAQWPGKDTQIQLHVFCDASEDAFAAVAYLRSEQKCGRVEVRIVCSKTRVSPKRPLSIPKLELQAAVLGTRLADHLRSTLRIKPQQRFFWSDSKVVRAWITSLANAYKPFVSHRIGEIQALTQTSEWRHVPGKVNPADLATRASDQPRLDPEWIHGPDFLWKSSDLWPQDEQPVNPVDEEKRQKFRIALTHVVRVGEQAESLETVLKEMRSEERETKEELLTNLLVRVQNESFEDDLSALKKSRALPRNSRIKELSPFIDLQGVLRARGRLSHAQLDYDQKHPVILCPKHPATQLLIKEDHEKNHHPGVNHGLALLRQKYWVLRGREAVKRVRYLCQFCRKSLAKPAYQEMADVPKDRMAVGRPPFFHCSIDFFGPMEILVSRNKIEKRWGCIFVCMTTRAVHLELAPSLSTQDFLNCLRNFSNIRGQPAVIFCDNGTNFVRAQKLLADLSEGGANGIKWKFQPPAAPHWGGTHEALVKSAKRALTLEEEQGARRHLREHELRTALCEVTGFLNSRPLTYKGSDVGDARALTPNHFLIQRGSIEPPPGEYASLDHRYHFQYLQGLIDKVWERWTQDYLPSLLKRNKWTVRMKNIEVGQTVLVVGSPEPRGKWKMGRVQEVHPGGDGLVRAVTVRTNEGELIRPITKICPLDPIGRYINQRPQNRQGGEDDAAEMPGFPPLV